MDEPLNRSGCTPAWPVREDAAASTPLQRSRPTAEPDRTARPTGEVSQAGAGSGATPLRPPALRLAPESMRRDVEALQELKAIQRFYDEWRETFLSW